MDKFFLCCFITSMICSIESGLIYALITTKSTRFYNFLDRLFKLELKTEEQEAKEEYNQVTDILASVADGKEKVENIEMEMSDMEENEVPNRYFSDEYLEKKNIQKVIDIEDTRLNFTPRQKLIDDLLNKYINRIDTVIRKYCQLYFSHI